MAKIDDMKDYTSRMTKSIDDKLFFLEYLNDIPKNRLGCIVDFGCADGSLLNKLYDLDYANLIGFDNNWEMIEIARKNNDNISFVGNLDIVRERCRRIKHFVGSRTKNVLILSSVIHEVLHYSTNEEIQEFWKFVFDERLFDVIIIRDMMPSFSINKKTPMKDYSKLVMNEKTDIEQVNEFHKYFGKMKINYKNFVHYLLKYRYKENWNRECSENYFPIYKEELELLIPENYSKVYETHHVLPYIHQRTIDELGININENTHLKLILDIKGVVNNEN